MPFNIAPECAFSSQMRPVRVDFRLSSSLGFPLRSSAVLMSVAFALGGHVSGSWVVFARRSSGALRFWSLCGVAPLRGGSGWVPASSSQVAFGVL